MREYKTADFDYNLPLRLIADKPCKIRDQSKLLVVSQNLVNKGTLSSNSDQDKICHCPNQRNQNDLYLLDRIFNQIVDFIAPGDLLVFNDSKVIKARLFGHKPHGGKVEILIERILDANEVIAHIRSNKTIHLDLEIILPNNLQLRVSEILDNLFKLSIQTMDKATNISNFNWFSYLEEFGHIPLPPYIKRQDTMSDNNDYQTVYAKHLGSVAAPTAGLHFTQELLKKIKGIGANIAYVTLHVGSGTFKPVNVEDISQHKMHSEYYTVDLDTLELIKKTKNLGGKIIAIGTTSLRTLETIAGNDFTRLQGETDIFITPGFKFQLVDKLITNFHLPKSTLLMLVSAFAGFDTIKTVYQHAIDNKYRFFSYGDAMLLERD